MSYTTRWYQQEANTATLTYLLNHAGRGVAANPLVVLPTGSGKSLTINDFIRTIFYYWGQQKIVVATHVKELVEQNHDDMRAYWPEAPIGICSAGLGRYETDWPITYAGVKTLVNRLMDFGRIDVLMIDEAHLVSDKQTATYIKVIDFLRQLNPNLVVIGYTATPFRLGMGLLTDGGIFTEIVYDLTTPEAFARLFLDYHLVPPVAKVTKNVHNTDGVGIGANGDYNQTELQKAVDTDELNYACLREACEMGYNRRSWLAFCSGVEHANHCSDILNRFGVATAAIHEGLAKRERRDIIQAFKNFELRCITNNNILTTGFNHPALDFIIGLRATVSASLWAQMLGRGMRPYIDSISGVAKRNCLVADFARNADSLGTIDNLRLPRKKGKGGGEAPIWICDACGTKNHARAAFCIDCGNKHIFDTKLIDTASTTELVSPGPEIVMIDVTGPVIYTPYQPKEKADGTQSPMCLRVEYHCRNRRFTEMLWPQHPKSFLVHRFHEWWKQRHLAEPPATLYDVQFYVHQLRKPKQIRVWTNKKPYPEVMGAIF